MRSPWLASALLLSAPIITGAAMEGDRSGDLRLTIGVGPGISKEKITGSEDPTGAPDPINDGEVTSSAKAGLYVEISPMFRTSDQGFGWVGGPGFFISSVSGSSIRNGLEHKDRLVAYGLSLAFGPSFEVGMLRLEVLPFGGVGAAHLRTEVPVPVPAGSPSDKNNSSEGLYLDYGVRGGVYIDGQSGLLGVQVGYQGFYSKVDTNANTVQDSYTDVITGSGLFAAFVAGVAF